MSDRIPCCVPFCRRTASRQKHPNCEEIICGKCWRTVPKALKARRRRHWRRWDRIERAHDAAHARMSVTEPGSFEQIAIATRWKKARYAMRRAGRVNALIWSQMRAAAIEAAGGIA